MVQKAAEPCRNCGAVLPPGAAFCTLCGTAVNNRAASSAPAQGAVPAIVPVGTTLGGPLLAPRELGVDPRIGAATALVPGGAGRRLAAKFIDGVPPGILLAVAAGIGASKISVTRVGEFAQVNLSWLLILTGIAGVLSLGYAIWLWLWEAKSGKTPGNLMVGLRTTNMDGGPAGAPAIFLRNVIIAASSIVPTLGPLLVIISNTWDANGKRQGWHDKVAKTLVFNVTAGRNPLETGGIAERANFAPAPVPTISPVSSPLAHGGAPAPSTAPATVQGMTGPGMAVPPPGAPQFQDRQFQAPEFQSQVAQGQAVQQGSPFAPPQAASATAPAPATGAQLPQDQGPITFVPGAGRRAQPQQLQAQQFQQQAAPHASAQQASAQQASAQQASARQESTTRPLAGPPPTAQVDAQFDHDAGATRVRPLSPATALRLTFDDGHTEDITAVALIGRNPAGYDGEMISRLVCVQDSSRSVSKTHLHVRVGAQGLWVTDRNSTNGSTITAVGGTRTPLGGGTAALAGIGDRVHFGDRSFVVGRP